MSDCDQMPFLVRRAIMPVDLGDVRLETKVAGVVKVIDTPPDCFNEA